MLLVFLLKGIAVGFVIAVPVGPVGVLCVRRTIFEGRLSGFISGLGAASADTIFGVIAGFGLTVISDLLLDYQVWLRSFGGLFLVYIGIRALRQRVLRQAPPEKNAERQRVLPQAPPEKNAENLFAAYLSTFVLTITNPVTILAFLGIFAAVGFTGSEATVGRAAILVAGVLLGSLVWWLGLSLGAGLFRHSIGATHLLWLNRASGTILTLSGVALLASLAYDRFA